MQDKENPVSPPRLHLRIVLAENDQPNASRAEMSTAPMLEAIGHRVASVRTHNQVLEHLQQQPFDLFLVDVHMPEMDCIGTVLAIRNQEKDAAGHLTIIAMTPHPTQSDRKRCLAAGMDRYISKPRSIGELQTVLLAFSNPDAIQNAIRPLGWNRSNILERAGGTEKHLRDMVKVFAQEKPNLMAEVNRALKTGQADLLERTALKLGEELAYVGALELARHARDLAQLGRRNDFPKAAALILGMQFKLGEIDAIMSRPAL